MSFWLGDGVLRAKVPGGDGLAVRFDPTRGQFSLLREDQSIFTLVVEDLSSNANLLWSPDQRAFALTYSSGGAIGLFHARVFQVKSDKVTEVSAAIQPAVDAFRARHYCQSRGNNVMAIKWVHDSKHLMLMTEVYPTGDCGKDLGHAEGYLVAIPTGTIERHLTLNQLGKFPGICLENDEAQR